MLERSFLASPLVVRQSGKDQIKDRRKFFLPFFDFVCVNVFFSLAMCADVIFFPFLSLSIVSICKNACSLVDEIY